MTRRTALAPDHPWDVQPAEARQIQERLAPLVETRDRLGSVERVAGVDVGFHRARRQVRAAVAVLSYPGLELLAQAAAVLPATFPYIPGLLSFRELPAALTALDRLALAPDLILCDAHGHAHPRRFGLACHLGVLTGLPTIGVAKSRLVGTHAPPGQERGSRAALMDGDEVIGTVLRTRSGVSPVYVSVGHRVSLDTAVEWTLGCAPRYRLPETTRQAHRLASNVPWESGS